ncbi:hypothetical protein TELCIR_06446 [Teladorsagia circumcincta]|uniref:Uncharacterized protein n=1 Tax=Teladorsagia circumcincta TaxID=45464 RepID=A0A2G9UNB6_TELCI|nr:hypothetical protein TELCIR_06446 [Teladorsagia circumcincta]
MMAETAKLFRRRLSQKCPRARKLALVISLGLIVARGTAITVVAPSDGMEQIDNPFAQQED